MRFTESLSTLSNKIVYFYFAALIFHRHDITFYVK